MTHLASPQRRKAKNNIKVTDRQLYSNIIIPPTLLLFKQKRTEVQIIFIYNLHIYLDWFWPWLGECPPACWPQIKRLSDTQLTSVPLLSAVDISLSMCGCQVSPLLSAAPLLCSVRSFALFQLRAVHSPPSQAAPLTRRRYPWTSFLSLLVSSSSPHYGETHNKIRKITGSIIWGIFLLLQFCT